MQCDLSSSLQVAKEKYPDFFKEVGGEGHTALHAVAAGSSEKSAPSSLPPSHSALVTKPVLSLHQVIN